MWKSDAWAERLDSTFKEPGLPGEDEVVGGRLRWCMEAENAYADWVIKKFGNHFKLTDSFLSFLMQTLQSADQLMRHHGAHQHVSYGQTLMTFAGLFKRLRAAENLLLRGYPMQGYALLRDVKDQAIILAAVFSGQSSLLKATGLDGTNIENANTAEKRAALKELILKKRKAEERRIHEWMLGSQSDIEATDRRLLELWEDNYHLEVHGGRLTSAVEGRHWSVGRGALPILPSVGDIDVPRMYLTHSNELGWLVLRVMPLLQIVPSWFGADWERKWAVLNEAFVELLRALGEDGKKPMFDAFIRFGNAKFAFSSSDTYRE